jgi:hypothetical protein
MNSTTRFATDNVGSLTSNECIYNGCKKNEMSFNEAAIEL